MSCDVTPPSRGGRSPRNQQRGVAVPSRPQRKPASWWSDPMLPDLRAAALPPRPTSRSATVDSHIMADRNLRAVHQIREPMTAAYHRATSRL
jgi:hypothetical protein